MIRIFVAAIALLTLVSCDQSDKGGARDAQAKQPKEQTAEKSQNQVTITSDAQQKAGIAVETVRLTSGEKYLDVVGQVVLNDEHTAHVGTYTDGRVTKVFANVGDQVKRGAVLARMHSHDVHETLASYRIAKDNVGRQQNKLAYEQRLRDRIGRLFDLKSASRAEVDKAESDVHSAETDLTNAQTEMQREIAHLTDILHFSESEIDHINEDNDEVPVICPFDGTVVERKVNNGSVVEPGDEVFVVSDLSTVWTIASIVENDLSKVKVGDGVEIRTKAYPDEQFKGRITRISSQLDPTTRTVPVRVVVPNSQRKLKVSMFVNARVAQGGESKTILLTEDAVQDINGMSVVFVRKGDTTFEARSVAIGSKINGRAEITAGLNAGEQVVARGSFLVKSELLKNQIGE